MLKTTPALLTVVGLCASLVQWAAADAVIHRPVPIETGVTQIVSASVLGASPLGVQQNGATLYVATEVESLLAIASGTRTSTLLSTPTTVVFTFAEGGSVYSASLASTTTIAGKAVGAGAEVKCEGAGDEINCVQALAASIPGIATTTITTSYKASKTPIFTITGTQPVPTASQNNANHVGLSLTAISFFTGFMFVILNGNL